METIYRWTDTEERDDYRWTDEKRYSYFWKWVYYSADKQTAKEYWIDRVKNKNTTPILKSIEINIDNFLNFTPWNIQEFESFYISKITNKDDIKRIKAVGLQEFYYLQTQISIRPQEILEEYLEQKNLDGVIYEDIYQVLYKKKNLDGFLNYMIRAHKVDEVNKTLKKEVIK